MIRSPDGPITRCISALTDAVRSQNVPPPLIYNLK